MCLNGVSLTRELTTEGGALRDCHAAGPLCAFAAVALLWAGAAGGTGEWALRQQDALAARIQQRTLTCMLRAPRQAVSEEQWRVGQLPRLPRLAEATLTAQDDATAGEVAGAPAASTAPGHGALSERVLSRTSRLLGLRVNVATQQRADAAHAWLQRALPALRRDAAWGVVGGVGRPARRLLILARARRHGG